jgi:hypothetical protein
MNLAELRQCLADLTPRDFDGHTRYDALTAEQKLEWLSQAARFWWDTHGGSGSILSSTHVRIQTDKRDRE